MSKTDKETIMTVEYEVEGHKIKLSPSIVKNYLTGGVALTDAEYKMFVELAKVRKLNPFLNEVYAIKYSESQPATIVVGKDAIYKRANLHPQFDGIKNGIIVLNTRGEIEYRDGAFKLPNEELVGGWAEVYRKDRKFPVKQTVTFDEVAGRKKNGELNSNWAKQGATMVQKVASVRALKESFVEILGGMNDETEIGNDSNFIDEVEIVDVFSEEVDNLNNTTADTGEVIDIDSI